MRKIHEHPLFHLFLDHLRENHGVSQVFPHRFLRSTHGRLSNILLPVLGPAIAAPAGGATTPAGFVHGGYPNEIPKVWQSSRRKWWSALRRYFDIFWDPGSGWIQKPLGKPGSPVFSGDLEFWVPRPAVNVHIQPTKISRNKGCSPRRCRLQEPYNYIIPAEKRLNPNKSYCKYFLRRYVYQ